MRLQDDISVIKGVGDKTAATFRKLNIGTIQNLINTFPRLYLSYDEPIDIESVSVGERVAIRGVINSYVDIVRVRSLKIVSCNVKDFTGTMKLTWYNALFLKQTFHIGQTYIFVGNVSVKNNQKVMEHPEYYTEEKYRELMSLLQPVYPLTEGITNNMYRKCMKTVLPVMDDVTEHLPNVIVDKYNLMEYKDAVKEIHFPSDYNNLSKAKNRIIFDEFFNFLLAMERLKENNDNIFNEYKISNCEEAEDLINKLPYTLTNAQLKTLEEIKSDLASDIVMNRLVQGDVGSGKTIIAIIALLMCVKSGFQGALMVPTEVLAMQHYESFISILGEYNINVELLVGSTKLKEKRRIYDGLKNGEVDIVIGTHALIQDKVEYNKLGLVITDEQHRFGVRQRQSLFDKGNNPHVLVMSATPIPRTLAIIMYGDLDISIIDELPSNRLPIKNCVVGTDYRPTSYRFIEKQIGLGHQVYVICPMVSASETLEIENVEDYSEVLRTNMNNSVRIEYLHGKMTPSEKNNIMDRFAKHEIDVLVSTTVIEVGINVPNATVIMIENAERFGLAGLHQLRGRVGRGDAQSYCIMMCGKDSKEARERLEILNKSNDGFYIANEDLKLRGAGDFFGVRQSGDMLFNVADIINHADVLKCASDSVKYLINMGYDISSINSEGIQNKIDMSFSI